MNQLPLGGWRDLVDDAMRLERGLGEIPDVCSCGQPPLHLAGGCACRGAGAGRLNDDGVDCEALLRSIGDWIDDLVLDTLRLLPAMESTGGAQIGTGVNLGNVRREISQVSRTFQALGAAADEFRRGCGPSHLSAVKRLAQQLVVNVRTVDHVLWVPAAPGWRVPAGDRAEGFHGSAA